MKTQSDYERYQELTAELKRILTAPAWQQINRPWRQIVWLEIEAIKNRHSGMPPSKPDAANKQV